MELLQLGPPCPRHTSENNREKQKYSYFLWNHQNRQCVLKFSKKVIRKCVFWLYCEFNMSKLTVTCVQELDLEKFEELFKTRAQGPIVDLSCTKSKVAQKAVNKVTILDANRSKNLAITLRKANKTSEEICKAIEKYALFLNF